MTKNIQIDAEFKSLIPPLSADEYQQLEANILAEGCRDALVVWGVVLIDGHNRYEICSRHGILFKTIQKDFESREDAMLWMIRHQRGRRNLTPYNNDVIALREAALLKAVAKKQQGARTDISSTLKESLEPIDAWKDAAKSNNTSVGSMHKVAFVEEKAPETIKESARKGDLSRDRAYKLTRALEASPEEHRVNMARLAGDNEEKVHILNRLYKSQGSPETNGTFDEIMSTGGFHYGKEMEQWCNFGQAPIEEIRKALDEIVKYHRRLSLEVRRAEAAETPPPTGKYKCIVIDPPWHVEKIDRDVRPKQGHDLDYPTMTLEEIAALNIPDLAFEDGCHLYLWTTHRYLPDALELVRKWGFNYQCLMTWNKPTGMTPYSWMYNTEHVVFARRGSLNLTQLGLKLSFDAPVVGHSVKPDVFYERVRLASPAPRLEMFARREREGFEVWGNEIRRAA